MADVSTESFADVLAVEASREEEAPPPSDFTTVVKTIEAQLSCASYGAFGKRPAGAALVDAYRAAQRQYPTRDADRRVPALVTFAM